jgi:AAHS family 4-hydroxybenzoate transporter-like MFS transporter
MIARRPGYGPSSGKARGKRNATRENTMADRRIIEINELVDKARLNRFHFLLVAMVMLILWVDGTDFAAANVAAPQITKALGVDRGAMGQVFGAGNFGILLGSLLFGYVGDQFGRKVGAIGGVLAYSLPAIGVLFATSVEHLVVLRFIAGLGIGGVIPNVIALLNESAPRRIRATFVVCGFVGYSLGSFTSAQIVGHLSPLLGWQTPFVIAGGVGVILAVVLSQTCRNRCAIWRCASPTVKKPARWRDGSHPVW